MEMELVDRNKLTRMTMRLQSGCESDQERNLSRWRRVNYAEDGMGMHNWSLWLVFLRDKSIQSGIDRYVNGRPLSGMPRMLLSV